MPARRRYDLRPFGGRASLTFEAAGKSPHDDADMLNAASLSGSQREIAGVARRSLESCVRFANILTNLVENVNNTVTREVPAWNPPCSKSPDNFTKYCGGCASRGA